LLANHKINFGKKHKSSKKKIKDFFQPGLNGRNATLSLPKLGKAYAMVSDASALQLDVDFGMPKNYSSLYTRPRLAKNDQMDHLQTEPEQAKDNQTLPSLHDKS
jgi:hypothetical protein